MKKIAILFITLAPALVKAQEKTTIISGKLKNIKDTINWVYLYYASEGKRITDSSEVKKDTYSFHVTINEPTQVSLRVGKSINGKITKLSDKKDIAVAFIQPGKIAIKNVDSFSNIVVSGSKANNDFVKLNNELKPYNQKREVLIKAYTEANKSQNKEAAKKAENEIDAIDATIQEQVYRSFFVKNTSSPIALYTLQRYAGYDIDADKVEPLFNHLPAHAQNYFTGQAFKKQIEIAKITGIGKSAPEFTQTDTLGNPVSLSSFKGKYVLVDFWASWCGPCRRENPNVVKAFNKYKDKGFTILSISLDQPNAKDKWLKAIHDDGLAWTHVSDLQFWNNAVAKQYGIQAIPQNFLLDPQGKIIGKSLRGEELDAKLNSLLP
jgi:peroxiredoxin